MRSLRSLLVLLSLGSGCALVLGLEDRTEDPTFGSTTGSPAGGPCVTPADCPLPGNSCFVRVCVAGTCGLTDAPEGTLVASQKEGDCRRVACDASGNAIEVPDETDPFDDGRPCTVDYCDGTKPTHKPEAVGKGCGDGKICNNVGSCVECGKNEDCRANQVCDNGKCVPDTCKDMTKSSGETDVDCGGPECNPCEDGQACSTGSDCTSGVCNLDVCQAPTCMDTVKNRDESDVDCGGATCPPCAVGKECSDPTHCVSGVCGGGMPKTCQAPTCTDGVQNGDELDVDCGGTGCQPGSCDDGEACGANEDCASGVCNVTCQAPTCGDGVKNGTEEGVDCGGPCPNPCS